MKLNVILECGTAFEFVCFVTFVFTLMFMFDYINIILASKRTPI